MAIANCCVSLLALTDVDVQSFADFPRGTYRYTYGADAPADTLLLRKSGAAAIGVELLDSGDRVREVLAYRCLRGQAEGDHLIYVTFAYPPYDPASVWESGQVVDLGELNGPQPSEDEEVLYHPTASEQAALRTCIQIFWR